MPITLEQLQYGFDRDSRRTWRQRATTQGWDNAYVYDSLSQVTGDDRGDLNRACNAIAGVPANGSRWQYDETGNWHGYQTQVDGAAALTQSRTHDKGNRLMEVSEADAMRTDRAGRMLETVPGPSGDWSKGYQITWDAWSRIVGVASVDGETITPVATYGYDGLTRRTTRHINAEDVTLSSYYSDEWRPVEERKDSETNASISYLWGARHRDDLVRRDRATSGTTLNETRYVIMDYFNPAAITDESGDVTERYSFSSFGLRTILNPGFTTRSNSECGMEFAFQGQFLDPESGLMDYGYRYYLPQLGRWTCKDIVEEQGGLNLYAICQNNPLNDLDHLGLKGKRIAWVISSYSAACKVPFSHDKLAILQNALTQVITEMNEADQKKKCPQPHYLDDGDYINPDVIVVSSEAERVNLTYLYTRVLYATHGEPTGGVYDGSDQLVPLSTLGKNFGAKTGVASCFAAKQDQSSRAMSITSNETQNTVLSPENAGLIMATASKALLIDPGTPYNGPLP